MLAERRAATILTFRANAVMLADLRPLALPALVLGRAVLADGAALAILALGANAPMNTNL